MHGKLIPDECEWCYAEHAAGNGGLGLHAGSSKQAGRSELRSGPRSGPKPRLGRLTSDLRMLTRFRLAPLRHAGALGLPLACVPLSGRAGLLPGWGVLESRLSCQAVRLCSFRRTIAAGQQSRQLRCRDDLARNSAGLRDDSEFYFFKGSPRRQAPPSSLSLWLRDRAEHRTRLGAARG